MLGLAALIGWINVARAEPVTGPAAGSYEIEVRIEIPNVNTWTWQMTRLVCLRGLSGADGLPVPVLSPNNPVANCPARNVSRSGNVLRYDIACDARGTARAQATYTVSENGFLGQVAIVLGAKNMTMREIQTGRRIGACALTVVPESSAFGSPAPSPRYPPA
jgi:hypothetical protein